MIILSIESSTKHYLLALSDDDKLIAHDCVTLPKLLESSFIPAIDQLLQKANMSMKDVEGVAVGLGPGSFTSLRVGVSSVKALAVALNLKVVGIPSLDILAMNAMEEEAKHIVCLNDARRHLLYSAIYTKKTGQIALDSEYLLLPLEELLKKLKNDIHFIGDGLELYQNDIEQYCRSNSIAATYAPSDLWRPKAEGLALLSFQRFQQHQDFSVDQLVPMYLYPDNCQVISK